MTDLTDEIEKLERWLDEKTDMLCDIHNLIVVNARKLDIDIEVQRNTYKMLIDFLEKFISQKTNA